MSTAEANLSRESATQEESPLWYKDAVIYQLHVRAFYDEDGDGVGDFPGLTRKLDYLQDLGVTAIWLLPFYPSPLKDDGYDIADYTDVNPTYGRLEDFKEFLQQAHERGLRVITELVINHTSDQHKWFQRARRAPPGSPERDFYVWSDTPDKYQEARIIFKDFEPSNWSWDPVARAYYWHRFYHHQPDLNFDNPAVRQAVFEAMEYWLDMGVDGLRLDAIPYLYEREGTNCENLPETHAFLKELRARVDERYPGRMLLAEANQWPEDAIAYFGDGDECHTAFHFPLMPRLFMSTHMEDRFPLVDIMLQTPEIPETCQWFLFLRNHDELTLEMVTDEERDYMYRVYATDPQARINLGIRRRLAPLLGNNRRKIELLNGLLFSLPGTPVIYYGDEIGMGDNIYLGDRDGVRTPMQWSADRNGGFSRANPQRLYLPLIQDFGYHYESVNVETQQSNPQSLLWWMKRLIALRQRYPAFSRGTLEFLHPENAKVLAFLRSYEGETLLVVANLSRFSQYVELDLTAYEGQTPVEMFGRTKFPRITKAPYLLTLGPHAFFWFSLKPEEENVADRQTRLRDLAITVKQDWRETFNVKQRPNLEKALRDSLIFRRWFGGKARNIQNVTLVDHIPLGNHELTMLKVDYTDGEPETYISPISFASGEAAERMASESPEAPLAYLRIRDTGERGLLYDAVGGELGAMILDMMASSRRIAGQLGVIDAWSNPKADLKSQADSLTVSTVRGEQSNTSVVYGDRFILKLFRRIEPGVNPDLEIGRYLTEKAPELNTPGVAGAIEYHIRGSEPYTLAILQDYVKNEGSAWQHARDALGRYFEQVLVQTSDGMPFDDLIPNRSIVSLSEEEIPDAAHEAIGHYLQSAELLGRRTGELHLALARWDENPSFQPQPFSQFDLRGLYQTTRKSIQRAFLLLRRRLNTLPENVAALAKTVLENESALLERIHRLTHEKVNALRIRTHGDYHLGQVLYTGNDFVIIDFEGEPTRSLSERRLKRTPLRDVAGMIRSFHYAAYSALFRQMKLATMTPESMAALERGAKAWYIWTSVAFLRGYRTTIGDTKLAPKSLLHFEMLLQASLIEKAVYELDYELNNRPDWAEAPLLGILDLINSPSIETERKEPVAPAPGNNDEPTGE